MQQELLQHKVTIEVHVVQVHEREHSGISATAVEVELNVDALKLTLQHARYQPRGPLVEVAQQQARVLKRRRQKDLPAHQHARLPAPFYVSRTQVNIEYVNDPAVCHFQVTTDASPRLAAGGCEIVNFDLLHRESAQHYVAVGGPSKLAGFAN